MGNHPSADLFFGITKWLSWDKYGSIESMMEKVKTGNVTVERVSAGFDDGDETIVAAYWTGSHINQGTEYDKKFSMPRFNEEMAAREVIETWKKLGFKIEQPTWHLIASYG